MQDKTRRSNSQKTALDPVALTADLVRCPSVTPVEGGALQILEALLSEAGFTCWRVDRGGVSNLFARWGAKGHARSLGFNGHTDVVPVGDLSAWSVDPFAAELRDGVLWGRGAVDMKSGVAAFVAAAVDYVRAAPKKAAQDRAIIIAITGDEEGPADHGTQAILEWMDTQGERMSDCIVGEPTCPAEFGEMMKIGRRGALECRITATGVQGHAAYPDKACNPIPPLLSLLDKLAQARLDNGTDFFDPSNLEVTSVDVGNSAPNVIPSVARALIDIRFNDTHDGAALRDWLLQEGARSFEDSGATVEMDIKIAGESFVTAPERSVLTKVLTEAIQQETGLTPALSTSGGTSDARFVQAHCPVIEFGLVSKTIHAVDERVPVAQIEALKKVYARSIAAYFESV